MTPPASANDLLLPGATVRPHLVARTAALPHTAVTSLRSDALDAALRNIARYDDAQVEERERLSQLLHDAIGSAADRPLRSRWLQLRRHLYRGDVPDPRLVGSAAELPDDVRTAVEAAVDISRARATAAAAVRTAHASALASSRSRFQRELADPDFLRGLLLSSRTLYGNVARYRAAAPERFLSRDEQVERGLLRYFTRAVMKATPFARFCAIGEARIVDSGADASLLAYDGDPSVKQGHVRLNKSVYATLWAHLKTRPAVRRVLVVELNPTLVVADAQLHFLAAVRGREVFQRLARSDALDAVLAHVRRSPDTALGSLANALLADPTFDVTVEEVVAYLDALIECGLLRFRSFVPEQLADWDVPLAQALARIDDEHARRVAALLTHVRALATCYAAAGVSERTAIGEEVDVAVRSTLIEFGRTADGARDTVLYEDASTKARLLVPRTPAVEASFARLAEWVCLTQPLAHGRADQATMRHFFDERYPTGGHIPLLRFYEEFYREHFKEHLEKEGRIRRRVNAPDIRGYDFGNPFGLERIRRLRATGEGLTSLFRDAWAAAPTAEVVSIDPASVHAVIDAVAPSGGETVARSASVFCQLAPNADGSVQTVMPNGQYFVGFGKYFSRFLYMLPEDLRERIYGDNVAIGGEHVLAEICGDAHFNANLHPPLLPWEISYPTGESGSRTGQLLSSELDVGPDPADAHTLCLFERGTQRRVLPIDLGFLNPRMRPPLYQLLTCFTPGGAFAVALPDAHTPARPQIPPLSAPTPAVVHRPRFVFGETLVVSRRRWTVPGVLVPRQLPAEDDGDYLLRLDRWRRAHGILPEVYMRVIPDSVWASASMPPRSSGALGNHSSARDGVTRAADQQETAGVQRGAAAGTLETARSDDAESSILDGPPNRSTWSGRPAERRGTRDWLKPQYMDFASPLLVRLFARMFNALPSFRLELEERFPDSQALARFGNARYVSELIAQVDMAPSHHPVPAPPGGASNVLASYPYAAVVAGV